MDVRLAGKETDAKEVAPMKARGPMVVRLLGKATESRVSHPQNALASMVVRPSGRTRSVYAMQLYQYQWRFSSLRDAGSVTSASVRRVLRKAWRPMVARPSGKETDAKEVAPLKALSPMEVRLSGKETDAKEVAP